MHAHKPALTECGVQMGMRVIRHNCKPVLLSLHMPAAILRVCNLACRHTCHLVPVTETDCTSQSNLASKSDYRVSGGPPITTHNHKIRTTSLRPGTYKLTHRETGVAREVQSHQGAQLGHIACNSRPLTPQVEACQVQAAQLPCTQPLSAVWC